jgi:DNA-binding XRE family transcriptional regulator
MATACMRWRSEKRDGPDARLAGRSWFLGRLRARLGDPTAPVPEVGGEGGRTYRLTPGEIPEFEFVNLYGTDITAEKAIDKFPNQNPNPVLRLSRDGRMTHANPASVLVRKALRAEVGDVLETGLFERIRAACDDPNDSTMEVEADGTVYRLREARGWSREKLAAETGLSFATIQRLESGKYPRVEHVMRVADALGVSIDELLGRIPVSEKNPEHRRDET